MERLTEKVNDYWKTNDKAHIYYLDTNESVFVGNVIDRLAEFEDFMEEQGFESLEKLKEFIELQETNIRFYSRVSEENSNKNQALKYRWKKLKKLLEKDMEHNQKEYDESFITAFQHYSATENWVLDRMEELAKE